MTILYPNIKKIVSEEIAKIQSNHLGGFTSPNAKKFMLYMEKAYPAIYEQAMAICKGYTIEKTYQGSFYYPVFKDCSIDVEPYVKKPTQSQVIADVLWDLVCTAQHDFVVDDTLKCIKSYNEIDFAYQLADSIERAKNFKSDVLEYTINITTCPLLINAFVEANLSYFKTATCAKIKTAKLHQSKDIIYNLDGLDTKDFADIDEAIGHEKAHYMLTISVDGKVRIDNIAA